MSKVINNPLLGKTKNKEPNELESSWTKMLLNRTNAYIFKPCVALANIHEVFQNIYHVDLLYILHSDIGSYFCTPYTCLVF